MHKKNNRETEAEGIGWELFKNYLTAKEKFQPDFFLYENNKSAAPAIKDQIAKELGVGTDLDARFTYINSALVSAQNRQRFYVTNCGDIEQPKDRGILLKDILESGQSWIDKSYAYTTRCMGAIPDDTLKRHRHTMCAEPICMRYERSDGAKAVRKQYEAGEVYHGFNELRELHPRTDGKSNTFTTVLKDNPICEPVRVGDLPNEKGEISGSQATRIYAIEGKSVNLIANGGGQGAKTGLYAIPLDYELAELSDEYYHGNDKSTLFGKIVCNNSSNNKGQPAQGTRIYQTDGKCICLDSDSRKYIIDKIYATPIEFDGGVPTKAISNADNKAYPVYCVENGKITIKEKQYPIKLEDGYYIIRKLTVTEAARLQTMPDDYCRVVSATQAYKGLGNGWTAEVIIHLLQHMNIPLDEEIVVLSMYDGIGTGRYCLDKMGYKNVKYYATEIDKYAMQVSMSNYPDIIQLGDAFQVRDDDWCLHES